MNRIPKEINVGVVGCGYWGPNLVRNFRSLHGCGMRSICDTSEKRLAHLRSLYPEVQGHLDYARMLLEANLDAVVIATPVRFHHPMAKASLLAGKHTLIEKPMAASSQQCEELIDIAHRNGLVLMVGHTFLYCPAIKKIKEIVRSEDFGDLRYISARRLNLGLYQKDINVTWDLAPHDISIILHIMGELPLSVNCQGSAHITPGIEDVTSMSLIFSNNRSAIIQSSWLDPKKIREMTIVGSRRMIAYDDTVSVGKIKIYDARVEKPPHYDSFAEFQYAYHHGDMHAPFVKQEEPLKLQCQHFLDCIREGRTPISGGVRGAEVVQILEAASRSLRQNGGSINFSAPPQLSSRAARNGDSEQLIVSADHLANARIAPPVSVAKAHPRDP